jgi:D-3-phosphoglycerate dehydrogenase
MPHDSKAGMGMKAVYIDCTPFNDALLTPAIRGKLPELATHLGDPEEGGLARLIDGAVGVLNGHTPMSADLLATAPALKTIVFLGSGPSSYIDLAAAERLDIRVRAVRNYGDRTIAEHAFALLIAAARRIVRMDREIRRGAWAPLEGIELAGKTLGVVGAGGIGREMVRIAHGFGMEVIAWSRSGVPPGLPCRAVALDELLRAADAVSLHLALTDETRGLIDGRRLALLRPHAILVNTARGALIDEAALVAALEAGRLAHAALDVFENEPLPRGHPLRRLESVTLTPHAAYKTPEATRRLLERGFELLRQDLATLAAGNALPRS